MGSREPRRCGDPYLELKLQPWLGECCAGSDERENGKISAACRRKKREKEKEKKNLHQRYQHFSSLHVSPEYGVGKLSNHFIMFELGKMYDNTS